LHGVTPLLFMIDAFLYGFWLWLSTRWYPYRLTGMDATTGHTEIITFASENMDIEKMINSLREGGADIK